MPIVPLIHRPASSGPLCEIASFKLRNIAASGGLPSKFQMPVRPLICWLLYLFAASIGQALQGIGVHLNGRVLIDQIEGEHEAQGTVFPHKGACESLHHAGLDPDSFSHHKLFVWLDTPGFSGGAKEFHFAIFKGNQGSSAANDVQDAWRLQNFDPLARADVHEKITGKQGKSHFDSLAILPGSNRFVRRQERFDIPHGEMSHGGFFVLGQRKNRVPLAVGGKTGVVPMRERDVGDWSEGIMQTQQQPPDQIDVAMRFCKRPTRNKESNHDGQGS
ncbi:MAG TPA: hypothetical protein VKR52_09030 [Terracidiphilus sp.]|nr:hypothetical protein [Terracidiphilus sp.]